MSKPPRPSSLLAEHNAWIAAGLRRMDVRSGLTPPRELPCLVVNEDNTMVCGYPDGHTGAHSWDVRLLREVSGEQPE